MRYELKDILSLLVSNRVKNKPLTDVYYKDEELSKSFRQMCFVVNRFCGLNEKTQKQAFVANRYLFTGHYEIPFGLLSKFTPNLNSKFGYVKYPKISKEKKTKCSKDVVEKIRNYGYQHLKTEEIEEMIEFNLKNNKEGFVKFLLSCGFEPSWIKKNFPELKDVLPKRIKKLSKSTIKGLQKKANSY
jgi:hypothetical protein